MIWHEIRQAELAACLAIEPRNRGDEIVGHELSLVLWKEVIRTRSFNSVVVEALKPGSPNQIVGFGCSVFVNADFATAELERPRPGLNSRLLASIASGKSVIHPEATLSGASDPLDVVILYGNVQSGALTPEEDTWARNLMPFTFVDSHTGYCLNRIFTETSSEAQRVFHVSSGVWHTVEYYPECDRALNLLSKDSAFAASGSIAATLFRHQEPVLRLRDTDKHLLAEAFNGETDAELASRMNLSLSSIKKRWITLFDRIADVRPDLLPELGDDAENDTRGPQKRHRILAYIRAHPEELRPFRWRSSISFPGPQPPPFSRDRNP